MKIIGMKRKLKKMKEPILEALEKERKWQLDLRDMMLKSDNEKIQADTKKLLDESVKYCEILTQSLEEYEKLSAAKWKIDPNTILVVAGNLVGILLILNFEKMDIVRSKAMSFVLKGKL